jgi:hypothetical protein
MNDETEGEARREALAIEALQRIRSGQHWQDWRYIADSLQDGREHAQRIAYTNRPIGSAYNRAFGQWMDAHPWSRDLDKPTRSHLFWYLDHRAEVDAWREKLEQKVRDRLNHPTAVKRRYDATHRGPASESDSDDKLSLKDQLAMAQEEIARLKGGDGGSLFDLMKDDPKTIAQIIMAQMSDARRKRMLDHLAKLEEELGPARKEAERKALDKLLERDKAKRLRGER